MKRVFIIFLALLLALSAYPGVLSEGDAVITIDGIRPAFFAEDGTYLPPIEEDGVLYVPFLALAENLSLSAEADTEKKTIVVDGIKPAMFAEDGSYLPPLEKDGILYVPLKAFAESISLPLTVEGNTYALSRKSGETETATPTPEPTAAPTAEPTYAEIPLTLNNYADYFILSQDHYEQDHSAKEFYITYTATIQASTSYGLKSVVFTLAKYGTVQIPATGRASVSYRSDTFYSDPEYRTDEEIWTIANMEIAAIFETSGDPTVTSVSGSMLVPWAQAQAMWERDYKRIPDSPDKVTTSRSCSEIITILESLAVQDYKDSAELLKVYREKLKELKAKEAKEAEEEAQRKQEEAEKANASAYETAAKALEEGRYQEAVDGFTGLEKKKYLDSAEQLKTAQEKLTEEQEAQRRAKRYQYGLDAESSEEWEKALAAMEELARLNYEDAADHLPTLAYHRTAELAAEGDAEEAQNLLTKYQDSFTPEQQAELTESIDKVVLPALVSAGSYKEAYTKLTAYKDREWAQKDLLLCRFRLGTCTELTPKGNIWFLESDGKTKTMITPGLQLLTENVPKDHGAWQYSETGEALNSEHYSSVSGFHNGYAIAKRDGAQYLIDTQAQETQLPDKYSYVSASGPSMICFKTDKGKYGCTDASGKVTVKADWDQEIILENGMALLMKINIKQSGKKGTDTASAAVTDEKGKTLVKTGKYLECFPVGEDRILVVTGKSGKNGLVDKTAELVDIKGKKVSGSSTVSSYGGDMTYAKRMGSVIFIGAGGSWSKNHRTWKGYTNNLSTPVFNGKSYDELPILIGKGYFVFYTDDSSYCRIWKSPTDKKTVDINCEKLILNEKSEYLLVQNNTNHFWYLYDAEGNIIL